MPSVGIVKVCAAAIAAIDAERNDPDLAIEIQRKLVKPAYPTTAGERN